MTVQAGIVLALLCAFATNVGFLLKHRGACAAPDVSLRHPIRSAVGLFRSKWFAAGMLVATGAWALHVGALALAPLSIVQAVIAGGLVCLTVLAERFFGCTVGTRQWAGVGLTALGLVLLAASIPISGGILALRRSDAERPVRRGDAESCVHSGDRRGDPYAGAASRGPRPGLSGKVPGARARAASSGSTFTGARGRGATVAVAGEEELEALRARASLSAPSFRGPHVESETRIAHRLAEELGLASDDAGPRVFAAGVTGLFLAMPEHADPDGPTWSPSANAACNSCAADSKALRQRATR